MTKKVAELKDLAKKVRLFRHNLDLTQEELSEIIGCHPNQLGRIERAQVDPSFSMIIRIAKALGIHPCQLMPN